MVKVFLGGEGSSEIGNRDFPGGERVGALEALLRRVRSEGWELGGAVQWRHIRKFTVGAARGRDNHGDIHSIAGLVNMAYEAGCPVVAFTRDVDADERRPAAIRDGIEHARRIVHLLGIEIVGGAAKPALEGWILALLGVRDTEEMSRKGVNERLAEKDLGGKRAEDYVAVIEQAELDELRRLPGCDGLRAWIATARDVFERTVGRSSGA